MTLFGGKNSRAAAQPCDVPYVDHWDGERDVRRRVCKHGNLVVAVDDFARVPIRNRPEREKTIRRALDGAQRSHTRGAVHASESRCSVTFFRRRGEIVMEDAVDKQDDVKNGRGALDITASGRW